MKKQLTMVLALSLAIVVPGYFSTAAAYTAYTSETDFVAALDSYFLDDFNDFTDEGSEGGPEPRGPVNGFSYSIDTVYGPNLYLLVGAVSTNRPADSLEFTFTGDDVTAFGGFFWPTNFDLENEVAGIDVEIRLAGGDTETYSIENAAHHMFTGFITDEAIASIVFSENGDSVWTDGKGLFVTTDHVYTGTSVVPVPAAVWLLGSGLVGLAGIRRKRNG
jgi:hypothetical protein